MLLLLDPFGERCMIITIEDGDGGLGQDWASIQLLSDDVHGAACEFHTGF